MIFGFWSMKRKPKWKKICVASCTKGEWTAKKITVKHKRPTEKEEYAIRIRLHTTYYTCLIRIQTQKNAFDRTSYSSWQPTEKVQMACILQKSFLHCHVEDILSLSLNRAVPKESVRQLCCKWTCLPNLFACSARILISNPRTTLLTEWCYIFISLNS